MSCTSVITTVPAVASFAGGKERGGMGEEGERKEGREKEEGVEGREGGRRRKRAGVRMEGGGRRKRKGVKWEGEGEGIKGGTARQSMSTLWHTIQLAHIDSYMQNSLMTLRLKTLLEQVSRCCSLRDKIWLRS